jgi:1-acyl-sn-glycerol-3-phosphate acyltransferase
MVAALLRPIRGAVSFVAVILWFAVNAPVCYLLMLPLGLVWRSRRRSIVSHFMRWMSRGSLLLFELGGARFSRRGSLPTEGPSIILMNHQSQIDILNGTLMGRPYTPAFVPRARYTHWYIPLVSACIYLLECPVVDPKRDAKGAVDAMRRAGLEQNHGLLVFPEGHRSLDGEVRPFKAAGTIAALSARRMPVYLVVTDGLWVGRRFVDFLSAVPHLRGETEVLGPFEPPSAEEEIPAFVEQARSRIVHHLREMRQRRASA